MKATTNRIDAALERHLDQALAEIAQPAAVDLRARVLAGLDARPRVAPIDRAFWRPATAIAGALVVLLGVWLLWQRADQQLNLAHGGAAEVPRAAAPLDRQQPPTGVAALAPRSAGLAAPQRRSAQIAGPQPRKTRLATPKPRSGEGWVEWPAQQEAVASNTPHLPGAPAGELGDPLEPLPVPPPIAIAPITQAPIVSAPPISDIARPVTDFPADDQPPGVPVRTTGQSGGTRR